MLIRSAAMLLGIVTCVALVGCGDSGDSPTGPQTGSVLLRLTTTGKRPDPDGFLARVDGGVPQVVPVNGTVEFQALAGGTHILTLDGVAWNCTLSATTMNVQAVPGTQTSVSLTAHCPRILSNEVLFATEQYGFVEVAAMSPDGTARDRITTDQRVNTSPSASPDGRSIAFSSMRDGTWSLFVMDAEGTNIREIGRSSFDGNAAIRRLTSDVAQEEEPTWSPDGTEIIYQRVVDGRFQLYRIAASGGASVRISPPQGSDSSPSWVRPQL